MSEKIDSYAHLGLPRFVTAEEFLTVMDRNGIQRAIVAGADTCPDLVEVSRAAVEYENRFRAVGVPLGNSPEEIADSIRHQAACGFLGIRIFDRTIAAYPALLSLMGDLNLIPWVVGSPALAPAARLLVEYLVAAPDRWVVAPHFAGVADPAVLDSPGPVRDLFQHPRFLIIFSRHGAAEAQQVHRWAKKLVSFAGWERLMYGSEFPVCQWRNESYPSTLGWVRSLEVPFSPESEAAYFGGNAVRALWVRPLPPARTVEERYRPVNWPMPVTIPLFVNQGFDFPVAVHRYLMERYLAGDDQLYPDYRAFLTAVLSDAIAGLRDQSSQDQT